jgi:hypothetical protein
VLPFAARVGEAKVDILDVFVLDSLENVLASRHFTPLVFMNACFRDFEVTEGRIENTWKSA